MRYQQNGNGYAAGCRNPRDFLSSMTFLEQLAGGLEPVNLAVRAQMLRMLPNWVSIDQSLEDREVEGELVGSFQTWTDTPMAQWHKWYDWNFLSRPTVGYEYLRGLGNQSKFDPNKIDDPRIRLILGRNSCNQVLRITRSTVKTRYSATAAWSKAWAVSRGEADSTRSDFFCPFSTTRYTTNAQ